MSDVEYIIELPDWPDYLISTFGYVYSEKTGELVKLKGRKNKKGYLCVGLWKDGKQYPKRIHRLVAETLIKKVKGKDWIDHINQIKTDNRIENLRWCNGRENNINKGLDKNNTSGHRGVSYDKRYNKWNAYINIETGKKKSKRFKCKEDAIKWRKDMEDIYYII